MKTSRITLSILSVFLLNTVGFSQSPGVNPPHHVTEAACPGYETYQVTGMSLDSCTDVTIEVIEGEYENFVVSSSDPFSFNIEWVDTSHIAKIRVKSTICAVNTVLSIPILSVSDQSPVIEGCESLVIGKIESFELTAELLYEIKGPQDPEEVEEYQWEIESGGNNWNMTFVNAPDVLRKTAQFVTDVSSDATIRVRGRSRCGGWSEWAYCDINRYVKDPCPIIGAPSYLICEDMNPFALNATVTPSLQGYSYEWELPSGWDGQPFGVGNLVVVTPNGLNGGTVSLVAKAFGKTSNPCIVNIPLEPIEPSTTVQGGSFLCGQGQYSLSDTPPPSSVVSWVVSPSNATSPASGAGSTAILSGSSYNGFATIIFTISTPCGVKTRSRTFYTGLPRISNVVVDGKPGTVVQICPHESGGGHWIDLSLQGDFNNCIDLWNDFGTTATNWASCTQFDFTLNYIPSNNPPYQTVFVNASASNQCGTTSQNIIAIPSFFACKQTGYGYGFDIYPNPASYNVQVNLHLAVDGVKEAVHISNLQILDSKGVLVYNRLIDGLVAEIDVSNFKEGVYYVITQLEGGQVIDELLISR